MNKIKTFDDKFKYPTFVVFVIIFNLTFCYIKIHGIFYNFYKIMNYSIELFIIFVFQINYFPNKYKSFVILIKTV